MLQIPTSIFRDPIKEDILAPCPVVADYNKRVRLITSPYNVEISPQASTSVETDFIVDYEENGQDKQKLSNIIKITLPLVSGNLSYVDQTLTLHQLIVKLLKCKQTVDQRNCSDAYELLDKFTNLYFEQHGIDHLKKLRKEK